MSRLNGGDGVKAVRAGQSKIHNRHIRPNLVVQGKSLLSAVSFPNNSQIVPPVENGAKRHPRQKVIFDQQNSYGSVHLE